MPFLEWSEAATTWALLASRVRSADHTGRRLKAKLNGEEWWWAEWLCNHNHLSFVFLPFALFAGRESLRSSQSHLFAFVSAMDQRRYGASPVLFKPQIPSLDIT